MSYLSAAALATLNVNPGMIEVYYTNTWRQFASDLGYVDSGMHLGSSMLPVAFAAVVAFDLKAYGNEPANVTDLPSLLASPTLACDDYVRLTWWFTTLMPQVNWAPAKIAALGWDSGAVGNHAQMMVTDGKYTLLLDPTVGIVAQISYDGLFYQQADAIPLTSFCSYHPERGIDGFEQSVRSAVLNGRYRPSDALYYVDSLAKFNTMPQESEWMTPAASAFQMR
jgi:hypothetical protein